MQKSGLLSVAFVVALFNCSAQKNTVEIFVLSIGPSFPIGNYDSKNLMMNSAGFAKAGETAIISYYFKKKKQFGFTAALQAQRNPLNTKALESSFSKARFNQLVIFASAGNYPPPPSYSYTTYPNWKFDKHSWLTASLLAGGYGEWAAHNPSLSLFSKAMVGVIYAASPKLNGSSITDTATAYLLQNSRSGFGFTYLVSAGIKYHLTKKLSLLGNLEYSGTPNIKFKKIQTVFFTTHGSPNDPGNYRVSQSLVTADGKQKITAINFIIGIGWLL